MINVKKEGPVTITVTTKDATALQELTGYSRKTKLGRLAAMNGIGRKRVAMSDICNQWVDYFRRVPISTFRPDNTRAKEARRKVGLAKAKAFNRIQGTGQVED